VHEHLEAKEYLVKANAPLSMVHYTFQTTITIYSCLAAISAGAAVECRLAECGCEAVSS